MVAEPIVERDQARALGTLVLAFAADPVERWLYPESQQYLTYFPPFLAAFGGRERPGAPTSSAPSRSGCLPASMRTATRSWPR